jgi:hypothetical protein
MFTLISTVRGGGGGGEVLIPPEERGSFARFDFGEILENAEFKLNAF